MGSVDNLLYACNSSGNRVLTVVSGEGTDKEFVELKKKLVTVLRWVHSKYSPYFYKLSRAYAVAAASELITSGELLSEFKKERKNIAIDTGVLVTLQESIMWSAVYCSSGDKGKMKYALISDRQDVTDDTSWNCIVVADYPEGIRYTIQVDGSTTHVPVLSVSDDEQEVALASTKSR